MSSLEPLASQVSQAQAPKVDLPEAVQKRLKNERITYIALSVLTLGFYALGVFIMDKIQAKWINQLFMPSAGQKPNRPHPNRIQIPTFDKVNLDATEVLCKNPTNKWVIYFCPNGGLYENIVDEMDMIRRMRRMPMFSHQEMDNPIDPEQTDANILFFNYRGCGHSEGILKGAAELLLDGSAAVEHLKRKGIENKDITLFGFSIGGAVGPTVAQHYPGMKYCGDRPPASISAVVSSLATRLIGPIVKLTRFEIDAFKAWKKIPDQDKAVICHHKDGVIKYPASLYFADKKWRKQQHPEWRVQKTTKAGKKTWGLIDQHKPTHVTLKDSQIHPLRAHNRSYRPSEAKAILAITRQLIHS